MIIATWNVNSIRARKERLFRYLEKNAPDVLCIQELKAQEEEFPFEELSLLGYKAQVFGQRTYNGVAIISKGDVTSVKKGLPLIDEKGEARLISGFVFGIQVICAYFPNGQEVGTDKYDYKLSWIKALERYICENYSSKDPIVLCGDFNIAPDERDVSNPQQDEGSVFFNPDMRAAFANLTKWGFVDAFRIHHKEGGLFSWWDYRGLSFPKNIGLRIDHILLTKPLAERCVSCYIDRKERKGEKPSDHAPVVAVIQD